MRKVKGKVLVAGSAACGKSALLQMYCTGDVNFLKDYQPTQVAEICSKLIPFEEQDKDVELFFFDLGGSSIYSHVLSESKLLQNPDLLMICYDPTRKSSFEEVSQWFDKIKKATGLSTIPGTLVATKLDLKQIREVTEQEGLDLAKKLKLEFFQVSTARNQDIDQPFQYLAKELIRLR